MTWALKPEWRFPELILDISDIECGAEWSYDRVLCTEAIPVVIWMLKFANFIGQCSIEHVLIVLEPQSTGAPGLPRAYPHELVNTQ